MKKKEAAKPTADVGVIVGRFQVPNLHDAHIELIESVRKEHHRVIIFLGLSPCKVTKSNPLDFEARKQMIIQSFPDINVLYIKDTVSDEVWSKKLDENISDIIGPNQTVMLYGGRDSFIKHYTGKFPITELESDRFISGTEIRNSIGNKVKASPDFRAGVIWAAYNQYPKVFPTVDIAVLNEEENQVLLAKKPFEDKYRFIGGFADPNSPSYETDARREVMEEANIEINDLKYIGSAIIDDWRYRNEVDKIKSMLFIAKYMYGRPQGGDDVSEVRWFDISKFINMKEKGITSVELNNFTSSNIVPEHRNMFNMLIANLNKNNF